MTSLPLISAFVTKSVRTVLAGFVAPSSYTIDLDRILVGSDVRVRSQHIGVLAIQILRAEDLRAADSNGESDPYATVSYARFGKPLYVTRIIAGTRNPVRRYGR